jgi:hypothetical protein
MKLKKNEWKKKKQWGNAREKKATAFIACIDNYEESEVDF